MPHTHDIIIVGAGHAGIEAALASARMGATTTLVTMNLDAIGRMSCNPAIGGLAKGHLVRELDALGGEMALAADATGIQFKMLNRSKGRAVWSPRCQNDRAAYAGYMSRVVQSQPNLTLLQDTVLDIIIKNNILTGIITTSHGKISTKAVVLTCGTFLNGLMHTGLKSREGGRFGEPPAMGLTGNLTGLGFEVGRLKTGTPPRIRASSVDLDSVTAQHGDKDPRPFSFRTRGFDPPDEPCYLTKTTGETHDVLASGLDRSPMFTGVISGVGPRYCPSIEDKIVRFSDRDSHQLFLEPEGASFDEFYVNGFSTSLPGDVQLEAIRTVPGLERVELTRLGYAVEYDFFPPQQLAHTLETKRIENLYFAGQINGTSGYEEAAVQGLVAGVNAVLKMRGETPFVSDRAESYIGVLIDDLVTKGTAEPYRMFTSRAEYRLLLRHDNADIRLSQKGFDLGLIPHETYERMMKKKALVDKSVRLLEKTGTPAETINSLRGSSLGSPATASSTIAKLLRRPELRLHNLFPLIADRLPVLAEELAADPDAAEQVELEIKYAGYLKRQEEQVKRFRKLENTVIPEGFDYSSVSSLSAEGRSKLSDVRPSSIGQASRISGVTPSDLSLLAVTLKSRNLNG